MRQQIFLWMKNLKFNRFYESKAIKKKKQFIYLSPFNVLIMENCMGTVLYVIIDCFQISVLSICN